MAIKLLLSPQTTAHPLQHPPAGDTTECRKVESMFPNHVVQKYYQYMAGVDQFDGFLNNMHPGNG